MCGQVFSSAFVNQSNRFFFSHLHRHIDNLKTDLIKKMHFEIEFFV